CDFGPGRRRRVDHRLEHLCRGYHRFSEPVALMNYPLLYYWDKFEFELYPEVASCNHDPVRFPDDLLEIIDGLPLLYFRDNKYRVAVGLSSFSRRFYVVDFLDKGYRDYVDFVFHAELDVFLVIACYAGTLILSLGRLTPFPEVRSPPLMTRPSTSSLLVRRTSILIVPSARNIVSPFLTALGRSG